MQSRLAMILFAVSATSGCSREAAPAAPTVGTPTPGVTLRGRVTEAAPTTVIGLSDATVALSDGTTTWSSQRTVGGPAQGTYSISGLRPGRYEAIASAGGYVSAARAITIDADTTTDFPLMPVPRTVSHTFEFQISDGDGTCSDGIQSRPCRITAIPIHTAGPIDATLSWKADGPITLNVTLFQSDQPTPLARSAALANGSQRLALHLPGGAVYELRITYVSGIGSASYALHVIHQN